jgi:hypothetical protein
MVVLLPIKSVGCARAFVREYLTLALGGLMSDRPIIHLSEAVARLRRAMTRALQTERPQAAAAAARADRVAFVAEVAMVRTAEVAKLEEQLIRSAPLADERLRGIADMAAWAMARLVQDQIDDPYRDQGYR